MKHCNIKTKFISGFKQQRQIYLNDQLYSVVPHLIATLQCHLFMSLFYCWTFLVTQSSFISVSFTFLYPALVCCPVSCQLLVYYSCVPHIRCKSTGSKCEHCDIRMKCQLPFHQLHCNSQVMRAVCNDQTDLKPFQQVKQL